MSDSYYFDVSMVAEQRLDRLQSAQTELMLQQAGLARRGWAARQTSKALCEVGRLMVAVGEKLMCSTSESLSASASPQQWVGSTASR
jgi:hypothetical protein